jgi:diguanylate cyclase (GGDEF)-like protein
LTGLPNRELLHDRMDQAIRRSHRDGLYHAGLFVDIDGFKQFNDNYGHDVGDHVLKTVATRLMSAVREADTVARLGGDEFFVLLYNVGSLSNARAKADSLLARIRAPLPDMPEGFALTASIGVCPFPYVSANVGDVIRRADQAMYEAKEAGKDQYVVADVE